jgi:tRNA(fMet)-specific endonuclease VapC
VVEARYLLDANVFAEPLRPQPNPQVLGRLDAHRSQLATAAMVVHEMLFGWERLPASRRKNAIGAYLEGLLTSTLPILPYDRQAASWHARERARLERLGRPVSYRDSQIGAVARVHNLVLVTANVSDFAPLSEHAVEDWRS